ncbi:MAG: (2Fe-2S) ferredoxin domain-containing protein [Firmicutes bacterium]|nr:(2Fe-2S) ferredoxin domain-containing protein [Bacillota bacterium]
MKTIQELEEIRKKTLETISLRKDQTGTRVVVGMATCGIAAGARPVLLAIMDEIKKHNLSDVIVAQTGCIGLCVYEPIVEVYKPGQEKVTYVKVNPSKAIRIVNEHIMKDKVVDEYTIGTEA